MEMSPERRIALVGAALLLAIPGLACLCCGASVTFAALSPETSYSGGLTPQIMLVAGIGALCLGVPFVLLAGVSAIFAFRRKSVAPVQHWDEPIPPPI